jgi:2-desacetyl-2-hydroxyethyl bacteriochlorophyllide A dehydrogenase
LITPLEGARRIIFPEKGLAVLESYELPPLQHGQVCVRSCYSLISIGTETTILQGRYAPDSHFARMFSFPQLQTGVQAVGAVEAVHPTVNEFEPGDTVFMRRAHGSHQLLAAAECSPVPAAIDLKSACWCGLAKTAFRAAWAGPFESASHVLIIGAGPVGQMAVRWAIASGCASVTVVDVSPYRLQHAQRAGQVTAFCGDIAELLEPIAQIDGGNGPDIVVDSTGSPKVFTSALAAAARFGKVLILGDTGYPSRQCLSSEVMTKGLTIQATHDSHDRDGWSQRRVDRHFFEEVLKGSFKLGGLISDEFAPHECERAYNLIQADTDNTMGVLFDWTTVE